MRTVLITGTAGFIGFHLARHLLAEGFKVVGVDAMTEYYDVGMKRRRHAILRESNAFSAEDFARVFADPGQPSLFEADLSSVSAILTTLYTRAPGSGS